MNLSKENCCFCKIIKGKFRYPEIDEPFLSNEKFLAIASIGALVEGWSLIIPKDHQLSLRDLYKNNTFVSFIGEVIPRLVNQYGPLVAFEHGANKEGSITSCGTDHAHLHLVPLGGVSLLSKLRESGMLWLRCHSSEIAQKVFNKEYLFYVELESKENWQDPMGYLHILQEPTSQFFRRLIAEQRNLSEKSNYREYPFIESSMRTRNKLVNTAV